MEYRETTGRYKLKSIKKWSLVGERERISGVMDRTDANIILV